jgi:hypothetical protein
MGTVCPQCDKPGGALTAEPHCKNELCFWNKCHCGAVYSRQTAVGFVNSSKAPKFFPATT